MEGRKMEMKGRKMGVMENGSKWVIEGNNRVGNGWERKGRRMDR